MHICVRIRIYALLMHIYIFCITNLQGLAYAYAIMEYNKQYKQDYYDWRQWLKMIIAKGGCGFESSPNPSTTVMNNTNLL